MTEAKHKIIEQLVSEKFVSKSDCSEEEIAQFAELENIGEELPYNIYKKTDKQNNITYIKYDYKEGELSELLLANTKSLSIIQFFNTVFFLTFAFCVILLMLLFF